jgi:hypothetical protein
MGKLPARHYPSSHKEHDDPHGSSARLLIKRMVQAQKRYPEEGRETGGQPRCSSFA